MKRKIIFTVTNDLTFDQRMQRICGSLSDVGYEVTLVGRHRIASLPLVQKKYKQKRLSCFFDKGKFFYLEYNLRLFFFLLFSKFDAIGSVDLDTLLPGFWISKLKSKPCIFDAHEYFQEVPEVIDRPFVKKIWERLALHVIPKLKFCYTVGPKLAEVFSDKYKVPFAVIRNFPEAFEIPLHGDSANELPEKKIILYQGALNRGRALEETIQAMTQLPKVELWIAGEGDLSGELRRLAQLKGLEGQVKFLGYLLPHDLQSLTPTALIGINLLKNEGLSYYFSLANKFFDYVQAGVPVLNSKFPEYISLNEEHEVAVLLDDIQPDTISLAIKNLIDSPEAYFRLKHNCLEARKSWNWNTESVKLVHFYNSIFLPEFNKAKPNV